MTSETPSSSETSEEENSIEIKDASPLKFDLEAVKRDYAFLTDKQI